MVHAGASVAFERRAEEPQLAHLVHDLPMEFLVAIRFDDSRHELVLAVGARTIANHPLVVAQLVFHE